MTESGLIDIVNMDDFLEDFDGSNISCTHAITNSIQGTIICASCGLELYTNLSFEPEWRCFENSTVDGTRCYIRRIEDKTIFKEVDGLGFPEDIVTDANKLYILVTEKKSRRGKFKKAVIFACIFNAYKKANIPETPESIGEKFKLNKKEITKGLINFNLELKNLKIDTNPLYIPSIVYIPDIMKRFNLGLNHVKNVEKIYNLINNKSELINHSTPQSVISGLIFFYFKLLHTQGIGYVNVNSLDFSKIVGLSEITINKIARECNTLLGNKVKL